MVLADLVADLDVLEDLLVLLGLATARAGEEQHVEYFLDIAVQLLGLLFASAPVDWALPP